MQKMIEIRWHGRGGQGVKTACEFVAAVAINRGRYSQGFPEYGPERSGAPMRGFTRISGEPVMEHCAVYSPDVVVVLDESLVASEDVCEGLREGGAAIINTKKSPAELSGQCRGSIWTVDATKIALEEIGRPIPNMPMVGALVRVTGVLELKAVMEDVKEEFSRKFDEKTVQGNLRAIERAYGEVRGNGAGKGI